MNKKIIAIIITVLLLFVSAVAITSCNKDEDTTTTTNPTTEDVGSNDENVSDDTSEDIVENETKTDNDKSESTTDNKIDKDENTTGIESQPPVKVEQTSDKDEPETCKTCGNVVVPDSYKGDMIIGEYCDGMCDEWMGDFDI